jgi:hypothetical protein
VKLFQFSNSLFRKKEKLKQVSISGIRGLLKEAIDLLLPLIDGLLMKMKIHKLILKLLV